MAVEHLFTTPRGTPEGLARPSLNPQDVTPPQKPRKAAPAPTPAPPPPKPVDLVSLLIERGQNLHLQYFAGRIERLPERLRKKLSPSLPKRLAEYRAAWTAYEEQLNAFDSSKAQAVRDQQHEALIADPSAPIPQPLDAIKRDLRKRRDAIDAAFRRTAVPAGLALSRDFIAEVRPLLQAELDELVKTAAAWESEWRTGHVGWDTRTLAVARVLTSLDSQLQQSEEKAANGQYCLAECLHLQD